MVDDEIIFKAKVGSFVRAFWKFRNKPENKEQIEKTIQEWHEYLETRL